MSASWELCEAIILVRRLDKLIRPHGYYTALTGGALFKGASTKDLDSIALRMGAQASYSLTGVLAAISNELEVASMTKAYEFSKDCDRVVVVLKLKDGRRIDLFLPGANPNDKALAGLEKASEGSPK